jgi:hypothetical protein
MKWRFPQFICALLLASGQVLKSGDSPEKRPGREPSEKRREEWNKLSPEERESKLREWRKTNGLTSRGDSDKLREQLKKMSPEERVAKRKEIKGRLEKRIAELRDRQANGSMTAQEGRELERREQILKRFDQEFIPGTDRPRPVLTNAPKRTPGKGD